MKQIKNVRETFIHYHYPHLSVERRHTARTPITFGLLYSGMSNMGELIGDGTVVALSRNGLDIHGNHSVRIGMELSLLLYLPDGDDPLFVLEATVAWATGNRFGVEFKKLNLREANRLRSFLQARSASTSCPIGH
jgi:hypothetical protein